MRMYMKLDHVTSTRQPVFVTLEDSVAAFNAAYEYSYPVGVRNDRLWVHGYGLDLYVAAKQSHTSII